ncbi:MAG: hypothetical protein M1813_003322 [Trichoglossum hirsutum]|jgi:hypothetical protein|nr:MAG: hypothetical protein M1813_003322 [Trichoglossum hirsutum]
MQPNLIIFLVLLFSIALCGLFYYLGMIYLRHQMHIWAAYFAEVDNAATEPEAPPVVVITAPAEGS